MVQGRFTLRILIPPSQIIDERVLDRDAASMNFDWVLMGMADMYVEISFSLLFFFLGDKRLEYDEISLAPLIYFYSVCTLFDSSLDLEPSFRITFNEIC